MPGPDDDFDKDLEEVAAVVEGKLACRLTLSGDQLQAICPGPVDRQALQKLMDAVNGASDDAEAKTKLLEHAHDCSVVLVRLIRVLAVG